MDIKEEIDEPLEVCGRDGQMVRLDSVTKGINTDDECIDYNDNIILLKQAINNILWTELSDDTTFKEADGYAERIFEKNVAYINEIKREAKSK